MEYAEDLRDILVRKIDKAQMSLADLKLDYCRFIYGISHRSKVTYDQVVYQVSHIDLDSMNREENGTWSKPVVKAFRLDMMMHPKNDEVIELGTGWDIYVDE